MSWINFTDFTGNSATFASDYLVGFIGVQEQKYPVVALKNGLSAGLFTAQNLLVTEDTTIRGNLSVLGTQSVFETIVSITSALSVVNTGTGPALTIQQTGVQPIALFLDDNNNTFRIDDDFKVSFFNSHATGQYSVAQGSNTVASGTGSHAQGTSTLASGTDSHAEGNSTVASGQYSHAQGANTTASGQGSHAEGFGTATGRRNAFASYTAATKTFTFAPAISANFAYVAAGTVLGGYEYNVLSDYFNIVVASRSGITGAIVATADVIGGNSINGYLIDNSGLYSHAQGQDTTASGQTSHAEGVNATASGAFSHAEGSSTTASGNSSHAEGEVTTASGYNSHAAGGYVEAAHDRTWAWKGSTNAAVLSTTRSDQFVVSAANGLFLNNAVGINTDSIANALTVVGNISASGSLAVNPLTARDISIVHTPANDGTNAFIQLGEFTTGSTTASAFSGFRLEYNELTNAFGLSSIFGAATTDVININSDGDLTTNSINARGTLSASRMQAFNAVGIGTYGPLYFNLDVNGPAGNGSIGSSYGSLNIGSSSDILINPNNNLLLGPVGNVGIGTTVPAEKLTVNGNISADGSLIGNSLTSRNISLVHTPANDGTNAFIQLGEFTTGSTTASAFSGFRLEYNEATNSLSLSSLFGSTINNTLTIDVSGNVTVQNSISAGGSISASNFAGYTPYTVTFTPFTSGGVGTGPGGTLFFPAALSGTIPSSELSTRFINNRGAIDGVLFFANDGAANTKQYTLEFAKDAAFTSQKTSIYLKATGETPNSIMRPVNGSFANGRIVMPSANATQPWGASGQLIAYPYATGDSIYYRIGFAYPTAFENMGLSAGYIRIIP